MGQTFYTAVNLVIFNPNNTEEVLVAKNSCDPNYVLPLEKDFRRNTGRSHLETAIDSIEFYFHKKQDTFKLEEIHTSDVLGKNKFFDGVIIKTYLVTPDKPFEWSDTPISNPKFKYQNIRDVIVADGWRPGYREYGIVLKDKILEYSAPWKK